MSTERIQHERELFERYKKQRAPGANLQRIGDEYVDLDVQWHFETWLARANMPQPAAPVVQAEPVATVVERKEGSRTWFDGVIHATAIVMEQIKDGDPLYAAPPAHPDAAPAAPEQVEHERKLFEARMRRVAPGVNLEMIGDRYNELDTQWKFELWLDRAALADARVNCKRP